jgi:drug/metabolite transporter (DMT)-like permease
MSLATPLFFLAGWFWDGRMVRHIDAVILGAMVFQSFVTAAFGFVAWNVLLKRYGATALHSFVFIMPLAGVGCGVLLLGESITVNLLASITCVVLGIAIVHRRPKVRTCIPPGAAAPSENPEGRNRPDPPE